MTDHQLLIYSAPVLLAEGPEWAGELVLFATGVTVEEAAAPRHRHRLIGCGPVSGAV